MLCSLPIRVAGSYEMLGLAPRTLMLEFRQPSKKICWHQALSKMLQLFIFILCGVRLLDRHFSTIILNIDKACTIFYEGQPFLHLVCKTTSRFTQSLCWRTATTTMNFYTYNMGSYNMRISSHRTGLQQATYARLPAMHVNKLF